MEYQNYKFWVTTLLKIKWVWRLQFTQTEKFIFQEIFDYLHTYNINIYLAVYLSACCKVMKMQQIASCCWKLQSVYISYFSLSVAMSSSASVGYRSWYRVFKACTRLTQKKYLGFNCSYLYAGKWERRWWEWLEHTLPQTNKITSKTPSSQMFVIVLQITSRAWKAIYLWLLSFALSSRGVV